MRDEHALDELYQGQVNDNLIVYQFNLHKYSKLVIMFNF